MTAYLGLHRRGFEPSSYTPHQHVVTYSPHHLLARVSLAKRPRHKLQDALQFFCPTLFLPPSASLPQKKVPRHQKKRQIYHHGRVAPPHLDRLIVPPTRSPMQKLILHRLPPPLPCARTKHWSQICLVYRRVSPKISDRRSQGRRQATHPRGKSTGTRHAMHLLLGHASRFKRPSPPK